jgi:hypothetical protein
MMEKKSKLGTSASELKDELQYHFTHYRTRETFLTLSLVSFFGFGILAFLSMNIGNLGYVFLGLAVAGFLGFSAIEVGGNIIGFLYQHGIIKAVQGLGFFLIAAVVVVVGFIYAALGGIILSGIIVTPILLYLPEALHPTIILIYIIFSFGWAANGMSWMEGRSSSPPPIGFAMAIWKFLDSAN